MLRNKAVRVIVIASVVVLVLAGITSMTKTARNSRLSANRTKAAPAVALQSAEQRGQLESLGYMAQQAVDKRSVVAEASNAPGAPGPNMDLGVLANSPEANRYLIKNASLTIEVEDARESLQRLIAAVEGSGGYMGNLQENANALGRRSVTVQFRVPADQFDNALQGIEPLGKILNKNISTQDVTQEYVDTDSRTRNLKRTEERLLDHLNKSARLEDTLKLEQELTRVREEIEKLEGRLRFLSNRVRFSTVQVVLQEAPKAEPIVPAATFSTAKIATEAVRSLVDFGQRLWSKAIWVGVWSPVWLLLLAAAWLAFRLYRRHQVRATNA